MIIKSRFPSFRAGITTLAALFTLTPAIAADAPAIKLTGFQEVPAVITSGSGRARVRSEQERIRVRLSYTNLFSDITEAHLHLGQRGVDGGVMAWICVNFSSLAAARAPRGTASCTGTSGRVTVDIARADVVGPANQGVQSGDLAALKKAIRAGVVYVNVHTARFPAGEIRGQIVAAKRDRGDDVDERIDELEDALESHKHSYRTGRGRGHNNTSARTGKADL